MPIFGGTDIPNAVQRADGTWYIPGGLRPGDLETQGEWPQGLPQDRFFVASSSAGKPAPFPHVIPTEAQIAAAFWGGKPPRQLAAPVFQKRVLEKMRDLTQQPEPGQGMNILDAQAAAPRTTVMRDGIP